MSNSTRLEKLEAAHANRINQPPLTNAELAQDLAAIIHCGRLPEASQMERAAATEISQILQVAADRKAAAERQANV